MWSVVSLLFGALPDIASRRRTSELEGVKSTTGAIGLEGGRTNGGVVTWEHDFEVSVRFDFAPL